MMLVSAIAAFAAASADAGGDARQDPSGLVIEAVRYCIDHAEVGADAEAPVGFSADGSSGWIGGQGAGRVAVHPGDATMPCMVIAPGVDADIDLPAWFEGELDHLPEQAFYMVGGIDEAIEKAKKITG